MQHPTRRLVTVVLPCNATSNGMVDFFSYTLVAMMWNNFAIFFSWTVFLFSILVYDAKLR